jgi:hypothetical protein
MPHQLTIFKKDKGEGGVTYDRVGTGIRGPLVERVHAVFAWSVLVDEMLANRLRVHPLAEPCRGDRMERDVC